jgi:hypothetical protein
VAIELQGQLLAQERELESREGAIATWKDGLAAFERALGKVRMECDASCVRAEGVRQDFFAQMRASSTRSKQLIGLSRTLEECQILLCLHETDLEVQEAKLAEEHARNLHPLMGGTYQQNQKRLTCSWMMSMVSEPPRPSSYHSWLWGSPTP